MKKPSKKMKSELGLIAALTLDATLAAEEKLSKLAGRRRDSARAPAGFAESNADSTAFGSKHSHT